MKIHLDLFITWKQDFQVLSFSVSKCFLLINEANIFILKTTLKALDEMLYSH